MTYNNILDTEFDAQNLNLDLEEQDICNTLENENIYDSANLHGDEQQEEKASHTTDVLCGNKLCSME